MTYSHFFFSHAKLNSQFWWTTINKFEGNSISYLYGCWFWGFFWENVFFLNLKEVASLWFIYIMWNDKSLEAFWLLFEVYVNLIIFFSLKLIGFWMEGKSSCNVWFLKLNSGWLFLSNSPIILILVNKIRRGLHWLL